VHHFFDRIITKLIWHKISLFFHFDIEKGSESTVGFRLSNTKNTLLNSTSRALWSLQKTRNNMIFNGHPWIDVKHIDFVDHP
jgi:hypothetical protein